MMSSPAGTYTHQVLSSVTKLERFETTASGAFLMSFFTALLL
jgi:hypothetical protein